MRTLILGGARSGKSRYAEQCASESGLKVTYIATASAEDMEMEDRIQRHRQDRPKGWKTIEERVGLGGVLKDEAEEKRFLLVDCLTLWLSNILFDRKGHLQLSRFESEKKALLEALERLPGHIALVSNEIGQGVVPLGETTRRFVDEAGRLHQELAQTCDRVVLVTAGLPQVLK